MQFTVIRSGGKQYIVSKGEHVLVDYLKKEKDESVEFETLARGDFEKNTIELGRPELKEKVKGKILENIKGKKIRVARFKAKSRSRKVQGFRPLYSKVEITSS